jgi:hypothetical protein
MSREKWLAARLPFNQRGFKVSTFLNINILKQKSLTITLSKINMSPAQNNIFRLPNGMFLHLETLITWALRQGG